MKKLKPKSPDETKQRVLTAARNLFVRKGYFNATIPDIVEESGISIGSVYHHYKNKQNLAKYLYDETMSSVVSNLEKRIDKQESVQNKLKAVVEYIFEVAEKDPIRLEYMLFVKHEEIHEQFVPICMSKPFLIVQNLLKKGINSGELNNLPVDIMAAGFMGIPLKVIEMKLRGVITYSLESRLEETFQMCWNAIKK